MSDSSLVSATTKPELDGDHFPIIRHLRFNETLHGGWDEWSVACICGGLYEPKYKGYYIPSQKSAERIYNDHAGIRESEEDGTANCADSSPDACPEGYREDRTVYV